MCSYTVSGEKLAYFLTEEVVGRAKKKGGRKRVRDASDDEEMEDEAAPGIITTVSWQTVDAYIAAMVDLWETQKRSNVNSNPHPREGPVAEIMKTLRRQTASKKRTEYVDRGIGEIHYHLVIPELGEGKRADPWVQRHVPRRLQLGRADGRHDAPPPTEEHSTGPS